MWCDVFNDNNAVANDHNDAFNSYQKNSELSEETQYRYRPVNLLLEPYFLPPPVR